MRVEARAFPVAQIHPNRAELFMLVMHRRAARRMMTSPAQCAESDSRIRWPSRCYAGLGNGPASFTRTNADCLKLAHPPLARSHRGGGVALEQLDMIETLRHAIAEILRGNVIAHADECSLVGGFFRGRKRRGRF